MVMIMAMEGKSDPIVAASTTERAPMSDVEEEEEEVMPAARTEEEEEEEGEQQQSSTRPRLLDPASRSTLNPGGSSVTGGALSRKESSLSKVSAKSVHHVLRTMATRIRVANRLSIARRTQNAEEFSVPCEEPSSAKILPLATPPLPASMLATPRFDAQPSLTDDRVKEGILSGGELIFDNHYKHSADCSPTVSRPYIYITSEVQTKSLCDIFFREWKFPTPRIALFLLTNPGELRTWSSSRQIAAFKTGLMKAANTTSMLLVYNGLDVGVGKLIGEAIQQEKKEMATFRSYETRNRKNRLHVLAITNEHNLTYSQMFYGKAVQMDKTDPIPSQHRYELCQNATNFVILQTDNSSDDAYQHLQIQLIDHFTKRTGQSPEADRALEEKNNPFYFGASAYVASNGKAVKSKTSVRRSRAPSRRMSYEPEIIVRQSSQGGGGIGMGGDDIDALLAGDDVEVSDSDDACDGDDDTQAYNDDGVSYVSREGENLAVNDPFLGKTVPDTGSGLSGSTAKDLYSSLIPVVCLVIQGDYHCAKLVLDNLRRRNPVIVLRGSGGFADLLSYAYLEMQHRCCYMYQAWDPEFVEQTLKPLLVQKIVKHFPEFRTNALARNTFRDRIIECVRESGSAKGRVYLSILNMHNSNSHLENLSEFILHALFKSQNRREITDASLLRKDLYLTLDWNCPHVARDEVLRRNPSYNLQLEKSIFEIALLRDNREDFVDLFLSYGFRLHKYLTPFRLKRLIRYSLVEQEFFRSVCMETILGIAVWSLSFEELIDKLGESTTAESDHFLQNEFNQLIYTTSALHNFINIDDLYLNIMGLYPVDEDSAERKALAILAMWAVFNRRFKLCEILWKHSDQPIHLGLILSMMLNRMTWFISEQNLKDDLHDRSKVFSQFAIGVLDECYHQDERRSYELLSQENSDWDRKTAVDIAANGHNRAFIAHPCCQKWLTNTFNGRIRVRELSWGLITVSPVVKIVLSAFLIFPMYIWIRFLDDTQTLKVRKKLLEELENESDNEDPDMSGDQIQLINMASKDFEDAQEKAKSNGGQLENPAERAELVRSTFRRLAREQQGQGRKDGTYYFDQKQKLFIKRQPPLWAMIWLMWNSPITKFWTYQVFYILYLALLSLAVIWPGCGNWYLDTAACAWTFLNLAEHTRRSLILYQRYTSVPMVFKIVELVFLFIFLLVYTWGRVLIVYTHHAQHFTLAEFNIDPYTMKVILCLGLLYFYYRLFAIHLPISPTLGPLLYRFKLMVTVDFIHFMRMALILVISSGIVIQAILYPNTELSVEMFHKAFHRAATSLFLTPVDELTVKCNKRPPNQTATTLYGFEMGFDIANLTGNEKYTRSMAISAEAVCPVEWISMENSCPRSGFWAYLFSFQYLISLKLILMTLLYALFTSTANKLQTETDNIWKYQRYIIVIDFANRPALHAPLSIFGYLYTLCCLLLKLFTCYFCRICQKHDQTDCKDDRDDANRLSREDYNYWRHLAKVFYEQEEKKHEESQMMVKQSENIQFICEEMEHEKTILRTLKTKMNEMERLLYHTQITLENLKHSTVPATGHGHTSGLTKRRFQRSTLDLRVPAQTTTIHHLARHSPYPGTRIQRFPIADKFVSWEVIWINYDPVIYSRKRDNFPGSLKEYVDEDLLALKEQLNAIKRDSYDSGTFVPLPVFNWNAVSVNPAGLTIDRRSWIRQEVSVDSLDSTAPLEGRAYSPIIYKLDDGIPLNPFGRTGLRGKGNLARWGPNHFVMLIVTRSRQLNSCGSSTVEFALEHKFNAMLLPMRFIGGDKLLGDFAALFANDVPHEWAADEQMFTYFDTVADEVDTAPPAVHYLDSPDNTDNAWKEVKVYHVHFSAACDLKATDEMLRAGDSPAGSSRTASLVWMAHTEDLLVRIPMEQVAYINAVVRKLQQQQHQQS